MSIGWALGLCTYWVTLGFAILILIVEGSETVKNAMKSIIAVAICFLVIDEIIMLLNNSCALINKITPDYVNPISLPMVQQ